VTSSRMNERLDFDMSLARISELEERIAELKRRIPPHSIPPAMLQELEELEEELEKAREAEKKG
jgi:hypothetical protein